MDKLKTVLNTKIKEILEQGANEENLRDLVETALLPLYKLDVFIAQNTTEPKSKIELGYSLCIKDVKEVIGYPGGKNENV